jgi:hypothetical protein
MQNYYLKAHSCARLVPCVEAIEGVNETCAEEVCHSSLGFLLPIEMHNLPASPGTPMAYTEYVSSLYMLSNQVLSPISPRLFVDKITNIG